MEHTTVENIDIEQCKELFAYEMTEIILKLKGEFTSLAGKGLPEKLLHEEQLQLPTVTMGAVELTEVPIPMPQIPKAPVAAQAELQLTAAKTEVPRVLTFGPTKTPDVTMAMAPMELPPVLRIQAAAPFVLPALELSPIPVENARPSAAWMPQEAGQFAAFRVELPEIQRAPQAGDLAVSLEKRAYSLPKQPTFARMQQPSAALELPPVAAPAVQEIPHISAAAPLRLDPFCIGVPEVPSHTGNMTPKAVCCVPISLSLPQIPASTCVAPMVVAPPAVQAQLPEVPDFAAPAHTEVEMMHGALEIPKLPPVVGPVKLQLPLLKLAPVAVASVPRWKEPAATQVRLDPQRASLPSVRQFKAPLLPQPSPCAAFAVPAIPAFAVPTLGPAAGKPQTIAVPPIPEAIHVPSVSRIPMHRVPVEIPTLPDISFAYENKPVAQHHDSSSRERLEITQQLQLLREHWSTTGIR